MHINSILIVHGGDSSYYRLALLLLYLENFGADWRSWLRVWQITPRLSKLQFAIYSRKDSPTRFFFFYPFDLTDFCFLGLDSTFTKTRLRNLIHPTVMRGFRRVQASLCENFLSFVFTSFHIEPNTIRVSWARILACDQGLYRLYLTRATLERPRSNHSSRYLS